MNGVPEPKQLFALMAQDIDGTWGILTLNSPIGPMAAVCERREVFEGLLMPMMERLIEGKANDTGKSALRFRAVRFEAVETIKEVSNS